MATIEIKICDSCGCNKYDKKIDTTIKEIFIQTGWQTCPAGGSATPDGLTVDLCSKCMVYLIGELFRNTPDFATNKKIISVFKEWSNKYKENMK